ncbi:hypothetical protein CYMTET_32551 [Cymbomonas tetramitiformis]|uniref:Cytidyltransferase-like domain-containing protein n=1 Tax=Cymbomonas tetramitiformis TaxID=36881 RepID=A0AAE0FEV0_9CHLO|nr:hypothetical protein CYMTET_32551 [Cymbomonas tetramitiformis]
MCADLVHKGHVNIIKKASEYGSVVVGLLTDEAVSSYKRKPVVPFEDRLSVIKSLKGVNEVVPQNSLDYRPNLERLRPDFVVHGDDWKSGKQQRTRQEVINFIGCNTFDPALYILWRFAWDSLKPSSLPSSPEP